MTHLQFHLICKYIYSNIYYITIMPNIHTWYIAIGGYIGPLYQLVPSWSNYFFKGTEDQVKIMFLNYIQIILIA